MNKKFQIAALGVVLLAVIAAGVWLVLRPQVGEQLEDGGVGNTQYDSDAFMRIHSDLTVQYQVERETQETYPMLNAALKELFVYEGQYCTFKLHIKDEMADWESLEWSGVDIVSVSSGEVLCSYDEDSFYHGGHFKSLSMDENGVLWAFYWDVPTEPACIIPCGLDVSEEDVIYVEDLGALPAFADGLDSVAYNYQFQFVAHGGRFWAFSQFQLVEIDTSGSVRFVKEGEFIISFCFDGQGGLYYISSVADSDSSEHMELTLYSVADGDEVWRQRLDEAVQDKSFGTIALSASDGRCFLWGFPSGKILVLDQETRTFEELVTLCLDMKAAPDVVLNEYWANFAVDSQNDIYFNSTDFDYSAEHWEDWYSRQSTYAFKRIEIDIPPEDRVIITLTAPYITESITNSMRMYRWDHPEVEFVWDVRYGSRSELQSNTEEYRDQISVRMMTGDIGDLVMVCGTGLDQEVVTKSDVFVDLSEYLDACPFKDELDPALLDVLRGADGTIRSVPVAVSPDYLIWNMDLLDELGNPFDPDKVTWAELLDLAMQWKEEGTDLSLYFDAYEGAGIDEWPIIENIFLRSILQAHLYDVDMDGGDTTALQQDLDALQDLLVKWKELRGSQAVCRFTENKKALFTFPSDSYAYMFDKIRFTYSVATKNKMNVQLASMPKSVNSQKQVGYAFSWSISSQSSQKDAAWDFLQFLISRDGLENDVYVDDLLVWNTAAQEEWFSYYTRNFVADAKEAEQLGEYFQELQAIQELPYSRINMPSSWYEIVHTPVTKYLDGEITIDEAIEIISLNWKRFVLE